MNSADVGGDLDRREDAQVPTRLPAGPPGSGRLPAARGRAAGGPAADCPPVRWWNSAATSPSSTPRPLTAASSSSTSRGSAGELDASERSWIRDPPSPASNSPARWAPTTSTLRSDTVSSSDSSSSVSRSAHCRSSIASTTGRYCRGFGHQPDGGAVQPAARVGGVEVGYLGSLAEHLRQVRHQLGEDACQRRRSADEAGAPTVALRRAGGLHGADDRAERVAQRRSTAQVRRPDTGRRRRRSCGPRPRRRRPA